MSAAPAEKPNHLAAVPDNEDAREAALQELTAEALQHDDQAAKHSAAAAAARAAIMKLHGSIGSTIDVGNNKVTWKGPSRAFDKDAFVKAYPREANEYLYKTLDPVLDLEAIPPKLKNNFMRPGSGNGSIVIK